MKLKFGDEVVVEILHSDDCTPRVLNPEDLKPMPTFETLFMNISPQGEFKWVSQNETGSLPFIIEQFKWNKWVKVGEIEGIGTPEKHEYTFNLFLHSGENKFRIKQKGMNALVKISQEVSVVGTVNKPSFAIPIDFSSIDFSADTNYELCDQYGQIIRRGFGKQILTENLDKGEYYLCYDNSLAEFNK